MTRLLAWWIGLHRKGAAIGRQHARQLYEALKRAQQARADREILLRLDARSLRDIGIDASNAHLIERSEIRRQQRLLRQAAYRIGVY